MTVFVLKSTVLVAIEDGRVRWRERFETPLEPVYRRYAADLVPTVADETVIVPTPDRVYALDRESGERHWQRSLETSLAGPTVLGDDVFVPVSTRGVVALALADESTRWAESDGTASSAIAATGNRVCVAGGHEIRCLDRADGTIRWTRKINGESHSGTVIVGDRVLLGTISGRFDVWSLTDGRRQWHRSIGECSDPVAASDRLWMSSFDAIVCLG